ncbi:MAG: flagellin [Methylocella sp.]
MTSNAGAFGAVNGALGESQPPDSTMSSALNRTIPVMDAIKNEFVTASITAAASTLGATTTTVCSQRTYVSIPSDSLTTGVGSLVDAKMNEAAAKLATLQVQQQLGVQALRISHSNTQLILKLLEP